MRRSGNKTFFKGKVGADAKVQDTKTLAMLLREYDSNGAVPFHMPGHKRNKKLEYLNGAQTIDVTEIEGFDNLHNSKDMRKDAQQRAADLQRLWLCRIQNRLRTIQTSSAMSITKRKAPQK